MAGLQLAVWEALYDTTSSGKVTVNGSSRFQVLAGGDAAAIALANTYLAALNGQSQVGNFNYGGYLLYPSPPGTQGNSDGEPPQELFVAVPEPTTLIAGALLLLPCGAGTIRVLRKKCRV
jgi:hypothetical protein